MHPRTGNPTLHERSGFDQGFEVFEVQMFERGDYMLIGPVARSPGDPRGSEELLRSLGDVDDGESAPEAAP
jgi:hypothetical protein